MRALLVLLMLALAGCASDDGPSEAPDDVAEPAVSEGSGASGVAGPEDGGAEPEEDAPVVLAEVNCPLDEVPLFLSGFGVGGVTSTRCKFEDIKFPEEATFFQITFTWDAEWTDEGLGVRVSDQSQCGAMGGDGCSLGEAFGDSPVTLLLKPEDLEGHTLRDLDLYPYGFAAQPAWDATVTFYGLA